MKLYAIESSDNRVKGSILVVKHDDTTSVMPTWSTRSKAEQSNLFKHAAAEWKVVRLTEKKYQRSAEWHRKSGFKFFICIDPTGKLRVEDEGEEAS